MLPNTIGLRNALPNSAIAVVLKFSQCFLAHDQVRGQDYSAHAGGLFPGCLQPRATGRDRGLLRTRYDCVQVKALFDFMNSPLEYNEPYFFPETLPTLKTREEKEIKFLETADLYNDWSWWDTLQSQQGTN